MKKLVIGVITVILLQFVFVSCDAEDQEINANVEEVQSDLQATTPAHGGGADDEDEDDGQ